MFGRGWNGEAKRNDEKGKCKIKEENMDLRKTEERYENMENKKKLKLK
jgi:hypothetical protein